MKITVQYANPLTRPVLDPWLQGLSRDCILYYADIFDEHLLQSKGLASTHVFVTGEDSVKSLMSLSDLQEWLESSNNGL